MLAYDAVFEALDNNLLTVWHLDHVTFSFYKFHTITNDCIIVFVMLGKIM